MARILVVDDNQDAADTLAMILDFLGHETRVGYDGQQGVDLAKAFQPEIVILDINMPVLDGYGAAKALKQHPRTRSTILVALTAVTTPEAKKKAEEVGFDVHLQKPVGGDELVEVIQNLIQAPRQ